MPCKTSGSKPTARLGRKNLEGGFNVYQDKLLTCRDCGSKFVFSSSEQEFYNSKGFENEPGRCPQCREIHKRERNTSKPLYGRKVREMFRVTCAKCGKVAEVPFRPTGCKPVYCKNCYQPARRFNER